MRAGETMKKKEQKIVRFYSDNPEHRKAFDILQKINAEKNSSIQDFIISAINLLGDMELNADYHVSTDEEKVRMVGVSENDDVLAVYEKLNSFFKQIGHEADFDRLYEESKRLVDVVKKNVVADKAEKVARELLACGPYKYLKTSVKADAFMFDVSDTGGNLKLFMSVLDKLGIKLDGDQLYAEYQNIYDETVGRSDRYEKEQEKQWNKGRGR